MDFHAEAMVFTSEKPTSTAFSVTLAIGDSENEHRMKGNLILSIKERGATAHRAGAVHGEVVFMA